jgi:CubicO group peptidase (beta-lactamase class C family)
MTVLDYYADWLAYRRWYLQVPGVQVAVRRRGELVLSTALGHSDLTIGTPLTTAHLFRIASHSKTFAAVAVLQQVQAGRLRLDDPLVAHLPELAGAPIADRSIGELLTHSGGVIRDSEDGDFWQLLRPFPDRSELREVARAASAATLPRHEHFKYSNIAYGLVGLVLEKVTGRTFAAYVRESIAGPLGLSDLGGEYDPDRASEYAAGHTAAAIARRRDVIAHVDTRALAAATGCYATAADLSAFFSALLPGEEQLLDADSQRRQRRPVWDVKNTEHRYGLGVFLDTVADVEVFGHTGGYPGHITCTYADEKSGEVISLLTNAIDGPASQFAAGLLHLRTLAAKAEHAEADSTRGFTGRFSNLWSVHDVVDLDGRLFLLDPTSPDPAEDAAPLEVVDAHTLKIVGGRGGNSFGELMRYERDASGAITRLRGESGMTLTPFTLPAEA